MSTHEFQTEVNQLLHLIIHSLYSHKEIFLRELISNASDALDKLKYLTLSDERYKGLSFEPQIDITLDENEHTLAVRDNGIGMDREELIQNLGTIARSGTRQFLQALSAGARKETNLIGQFGVGFYSAFMVADKVEVTSRKPLDSQAWRWSSDGKGTFTVEEASLDGHGTLVKLWLNADSRDYEKGWEIKSLVKRYSNHVAFPIYLHYKRKEWKDGREREVPADEKINEATALWKRPRAELKDEDYKEFYRTLTGDWEDPLIWFHTHAEGTLEYTTLFYIPSKAPFDIYYPDYKPGVKLYVKRVFITDDDKELMPTYLRFLRGVIDSEDLPLNVSREFLQQNRILSSIRNASVKKVLAELQTLSRENPEKYTQFIEQFNRLLKEGLYQDTANRETLLELVRFHSTHVDGWTSLADYKDRMKEGQKAIYVLSGNRLENLKRSPLLEAYRSRGWEVLLLDSEIDSIILPILTSYKDIPIKSIAREETAKDLGEAPHQEKEDEEVVRRLRELLKDRTRDVRASSILTESPSCLVTAEDEPSLDLQRLMKALGQETLEVRPVLEVNLSHPILRGLRAQTDEQLWKDTAQLLLDRAYLMEGSLPTDPTAFAASLDRTLQRLVDQQS